jgi:chemotaxis methyl-accepting protein methylase
MWQRYIESKIGFVLPKTQTKWLSNAILTTAEDSQLSVPELWLAVQADARLRQQLLDRVLIAESRFFRHMPSLDYIAALATEHERAVAQRSLVADKSLETAGIKAPKSANFKIWSVGCARGQEVWSLAMLLAHAGLTHYRILGTDVNYEAIQEAQLGRYSARELTTVPSDYSHYIQGHYIQPCETDSAMSPQTLATEVAVSEEGWQVSDSLCKNVTFRHHNMFTGKVATKVKQQVIICQNMLIYFRQFDQRDILARLVDHCEVGGHIILAPGEALFWRHPKMQRILHPEVNLWQKVEA